MTAVRAPVAAERFYPADAAELASMVDRLLAAAAPSRPSGRLRALVAPHAGYVHSGEVAAAAFAVLPPPDGPFRVVLLGPSHFTAVGDATVSSAHAWSTPLGDVPVDDALRKAALAAGAIIDERPHRGDHALEVELPFLQRRAGARLRVLPVAVGGDATDVVAALAGEALIVVSTDLSHYHDDATARTLDRRTAEAVLALDAGAVGDADACGAAALRSLLRHAQHEHWSCTLLALRTSADASHDLQHVVGYGAFAFSAAESVRR